MGNLTAVHFGAGNIGRGFVGLILHNAGFEVVFADVNASLIEDLDSHDSYRVSEVGDGARSWLVDNYRALNSESQRAELVAEMATAELVTTAVGPSILRFVAPVIADALAVRSDELAPLLVMACENSINASDLLAEHVFALSSESERARATFANTAVDRIVPAQAEGQGIDVTVEAFFEWVIEEAPGSRPFPSIPEAKFVPDLAPFIERKLFTVNTGHAATAYFGARHGAATIADAIAIPAVAAAVRAALEETKRMLVLKHDLDPLEQQAYLEKNLTRFANTSLHDSVARVGRQPMRKLSRHERFVGPAAELAEAGIVPVALISAMVAAAEFDVEDDVESQDLKELKATLTPEEFVIRVTDIEPSHPLFGPLAEAFSAQ